MGDSILKKNNSIIHFVDLPYKRFITNIQESSYFLFNNSISLIDSFKYRFHKHNYEISRLLHFDRVPPFDEYWHQFLKTYILDIIIVACHYSKRFLNSDAFLLNHCNDAALQEHTLYLKDKSFDKVAQDFLDSYIISDNNSSNLSITWHNMYFLWKEYLQIHHFPNIIFKERLKSILREKLPFKESDNTFTNVSSIYLKYVQSFRKYWDVTIHDASDNVFEMSELCSMYKDWLKVNQPNVKCLPEHKMIALIQYFYPQCIITEGKYINNISSTLWDKKNDINQSLSAMKQCFADSRNLYQMYEFYCNYVKNRSYPYTASKKYFENTIKKCIPEKYFCGDTIMKDYWVSV